ncbi:AMP-binding protein [Streptomyces sp. NPDC008150]|uniref:AMP-dependent synthetase/ligase n=1 Tax=Streptomyces sp. NPDC008150 TaxID=3364816 RepID=UPI0036E1AF9B
MRDVPAPPAVPVPAGGLADGVHAAADQDPGRPVLAVRSDDGTGTWREVTAGELRAEVTAVAKGLVASGISPGRRVAIVSHAPHTATVLCLALWTVGAELVPVHPASPPDQVERVLRDTRCVAVAVEDEQGVMTVGPLYATMPLLRHVWQLDAGALGQLAARGEAIPDTTVDSLRRIVLPDSTAVVAHTAGTTGPPRACALSHRALASPCDALLAGSGHPAAPAGERAAVLSFLPPSHVHGLLVRTLCLRGGLLLAQEPGPDGATPPETVLRSFRPTYFHAAPSVFERIHSSFLRSAQQAGRGALFERAAATARDFAAAEERRRLGRGTGPGLDLRVQHALHERTVYRSLRAALGGRLCGASSAGGPLDRELALFWAGIGIPVHGVYGLTETGGAVTAQPPGKERAGTAGVPLPGSEIRVADDGEILVRGPSLFQGYVDHERGAAVRPGAPDAWLATGDVGRLDSAGHLTVTGRKRDLLFTGGGTGVAPGVLEQRLRMHPLVRQAVVVGEGRSCVGALITLDPDFLEHWSTTVAAPGDAPGREARVENALREEVGRAVAVANSAVPRDAAIRVFRVLPQTFERTGGLLTPSLSVRRDAVLTHYAFEIDAMYQARKRPARRPEPREPAGWDESDSVFR